MGKAGKFVGKAVKFVGKAAGKFVGKAGKFVGKAENSWARLEIRGQGWKFVGKAGQGWVLRAQGLRGQGQGSRLVLDKLAGYSWATLKLEISGQSQ